MTGIEAQNVSRQETWCWKGRPSSCVWVLEFMKENFHNTSPSDYERMFNEAQDSKTSKGLEQKKQKRV